MKTLKCNECGCNYEVPEDHIDQVVELCPRCEEIEEEETEDEVITGEEPDNPAEKMT